MTTSPSSLLPSQTLATTNLFLSLSMDFSVLDIVCKWNPMIRGLLCLALFLHWHPSPSGYNSSLVNCSETVFHFPPLTSLPRHAPVLCILFSVQPRIWGRHPREHLERHRTPTALLPILVWSGRGLLRSWKSSKSPSNFSEVFSILK